MSWRYGVMAFTLDRRTQGHRLRPRPHADGHRRRGCAAHVRGPHHLQRPAPLWSPCGRDGRRVRDRSPGHLVVQFAANMGSRPWLSRAARMCRSRDSCSLLRAEKFLLVMWLHGMVRIWLEYTLQHRFFIIPLYLYFPLSGSEESGKPSVAGGRAALDGQTDVGAARQFVFAPESRQRCPNWRCGWAS